MSYVGIWDISIHSVQAHVALSLLTYATRHALHASNQGLPELATSRAWQANLAPDRRVGSSPVSAGKETTVPPAGTDYGEYANVSGADEWVRSL